MRTWILNQYKSLITGYWSELQNADVKGKYNSVFRTYSTSQRDVQMKYKTLFTTLFSLADKFGVKLDDNPLDGVVIEPPKDEVLG
tara:strand:- start:73 stop:327 length:255 start_codon:yes stop_codon:yes gene_type:complete